MFILSLLGLFSSSADCFFSLEFGTRSMHSSCLRQFERSNSSRNLFGKKNRERGTSPLILCILICKVIFGCIEIGRKGNIEHQLFQKNTFKRRCTVRCQLVEFDLIFVNVSTQKSIIPFQAFFLINEKIGAGR